MHQLHGVRILTPREYERLVDQIEKDSLIRLVRVLMLTGARYEEIMRLKSCPECFNESDRSVWIRSGKQKARSPERYIPLTAAGVDAVRVFLDDPRMKYPGPTAMGINLRVWCEKAGFEPLPECQQREVSLRNIGKVRRNVWGASVKMFRRSWENWLLTAYPDRHMDIMKAQGHDATTSAIHYAGAVFSADDVEQIRKYVYGWKPSAKQPAGQD